LIHILEGCYTGNSSKQTPPNMRTEDKRVAVCADFCADDNFTHFGLMASINNLPSYNIMYLFKIKNEKYYTIGTVRKSNQNTEETKAKPNTPNTNI
jgi:ABC-type enterochelin transport system substrate-binding protein